MDDSPIGTGRDPPVVVDRAMVAAMPDQMLEAEIEDRRLRIESINDQLEAAALEEKTARKIAWRVKALRARSFAKREMGWMISERARRRNASSQVDAQELDDLEAQIWDQVGIHDDRHWEELSDPEQLATLQAAVEAIIDQAPTSGWEKAAALFRRLTDREEGC